MDGGVAIKSEKNDDLEARISETRPNEAVRAHENTKQVLGDHRQREAINATNHQQDEIRDPILKNVNNLVLKWLRYKSERKRALITDL